jgi:Ni/Fe-hydrogenase subunit HybB-like protein
VIEPGHTFKTITDKISSIVLSRRTPLGWFLGFGISFLFVMLLLWTIAKLIFVGIGIWGVDIPVAWGFAITNFVWWIGIGHAGTLISAILLLMHQKWRTSINRFAEAMTLFAMSCATLFPLLHMGRPWFFYWLAPYPNTMQLWPQFRSPLVWDVFAIITYFIVSLLFWYVGMIPDLATLRDRARGRLAWIVYGVLALGWRGSSRHWKNYETLYVLLAGLATPLVVSVHTIVSFDFSVAIVPGWHNTIFPPYFVAGAMFSGLAMILTLAIPLRKIYALEDFITMRHLDNLGKLLLASALIVTYSYLAEGFFAWYSGNEFESYMQIDRMLGRYGYMYWILIAGNVVVPQLFWFQRMRRSVPLLFIASIAINLSMWTERYVIVVQSLHRDFMPSAWGMYRGTLWDYAALFGSIGLFIALLFLFIRFLPAISMAEMRELLPQAKVEEGTP